MSPSLINLIPVLALIAALSFTQCIPQFANASDCVTVGNRDLYGDLDHTAFLFSSFGMAHSNGHDYFEDHLGSEYGQRYDLEMYITDTLGTGFAGNESNLAAFRNAIEMRPYDMGVLCVMGHGDDSWVGGQVHFFL